jgi:hypothetical protein
MSLLNHLIIAIPLSISLSIFDVQAETHLLFMGAGAEPDCREKETTGPHSLPKCDSTIFDGTLKDFGYNLNYSNWKYEVSFNGGHKNTESILHKEYKNPISPITNFTASNYSLLIKNYEEKINSGKIKSGDQLIILISAHGALKTEKETSHSIAASGGPGPTDKNNLSTHSLVSLDDLKKIIELANARGIKLGLVDLSCRSGNTLALAKNYSNTCIISATGTHHYAYLDPNGFSNTFVKSMVSGVTLEDAFLYARSKSLYPEYPMISTAANEKISDYIYKNISPYLYFKNLEVDTLTDYIVEASRNDLMCKRDEQFKGLVAQIEALESSVTGKSHYDGAEFKKLLAKYKTNQDQVLTALSFRNFPALNNIEKFSVTMKLDGSPPEVLHIQYTWGQLLTVNPARALDMYEKYEREAKTKIEKDKFKAQVEVFKKVLKKHNELFRNFPELVDFKLKTSKLTELLTDSKQMSLQIISEEKKMYQALYNQYKQQDKNNPCRKIRL